MIDAITKPFKLIVALFLWLFWGPNMKYLWYVICHKYFVFVYGRKLGVPVWALLKHDLSKFRPDEWRPYVDMFYRKNRPLQHDVKARFLEAVQRHYKRNPHHWQAWRRIEANAIYTLPMPEMLMREMLADWRAVSRWRLWQYEGIKTPDEKVLNGAVSEWYITELQNPKDEMRITLSPHVEEWIDEQLGIIPITQDEYLAEISKPN